jgi:hypothetical protein
MVTIDAARGRITFSSSRDRMNRVVVERHQVDWHIGHLLWNLKDSPSWFPNARDRARNMASLTFLLALRDMHNINEENRETSQPDVMMGDWIMAL